MGERKYREPSCLKATVELRERSYVIARTGIAIKPP
jgi:hypothetical protein